MSAQNGPQGPAEFAHDCTECQQPVRLVLGPWPAFFGHLSSTEDFASFQRDGMCGLCSNYVAEFAVMGATREERWWDAL